MYGPSRSKLKSKEIIETFKHRSQKITENGAQKDQVVQNMNEKLDYMAERMENIKICLEAFP